MMKSVIKSNVYIDIKMHMVAIPTSSRFSLDIQWQMSTRLFPALRNFES